MCRRIFLVKQHHFCVHSSLFRLDFCPNCLSKVASLKVLVYCTLLTLTLVCYLTYLAYLIFNWHPIKGRCPPELNPGPLAPRSLEHPCQATPVMLPGQRFHTYIGPELMTQSDLEQLSTFLLYGIVWCSTIRVKHQKTVTKKGIDQDYSTWSTIEFKIRWIKWVLTKP